MSSPTPAPPADNKYLERFIWLSVGVSVAVLAIKIVAAVLTGSIGLWSDALESTVNVMAAAVALWAVKLSAKPADHNHDFGHGKAEYVSAAVEGTMILIAAGVIIFGAITRFINPVELEQLGVGVVLSAIATAINLAVGWLLVRTGRKHRSITLEADGKHLLTDVWTSAGVLVAMILVMVTNWSMFDPIIAVLVGANILYTGYGLIRRSVVGLLDGTLPPEEVTMVNGVLHSLAGDASVEISEIKTRESGRQRFVYVTITVPGEWTVRRSHDLADDVEAAVSEALPGTTTFVHIEPGEG